MKWNSVDFWRARRVLVTGGSGFLGGWVCRTLLEAGAEVHSTGHRNPSRWATAHHTARLPDDTDAIFTAVNPEVVFHLAGPVQPGAGSDSLATLRPGIVDAAEAIATASERCGSHLVHIGTCAEYGRCPAPHREDHTPQPTSTYGQLKLAASQHALAVGGTVVRPFRAIGPGDSQSVVFAAAMAAISGQPFAMTEGSQVREWNHVKAVATGIVTAGAHPEARGLVINIGGGEARSVYGVVESIFRAAGAPTDLIRRGALSPRLGDVQELIGDHTRAEGLWGTIPQPSLDETLRQTIEWLESARGDAA